MPHRRASVAAAAEPIDDKPLSISGIAPGGRLRPSLMPSREESTQKEKIRMKNETNPPVATGLWEAVMDTGRRCLDAAKQGVDAVEAAVGGDLAGAWRLGSEAALSCADAVVSAGGRILGAAPFG
jgi:hypothetical protein